MLERKARRAAEVIDKATGRGNEKIGTGRTTGRRGMGNDLALLLAKGILARDRRSLYKS